MRRNPGWEKEKIPSPMGGDRTLDAHVKEGVKRDVTALVIDLRSAYRDQSDEDRWLAIVMFNADLWRLPKGKSSPPQDADGVRVSQKDIGAYDSLATAKRMATKAAKGLLPARGTRGAPQWADEPPHGFAWRMRNENDHSLGMELVHVESGFVIGSMMRVELGSDRYLVRVDGYPDRVFNGLGRAQDALVRRITAGSRQNPFWRNPVARRRRRGRRR